MPPIAQTENRKHAPELIPELVGASPKKQRLHLNSELGASNDVFSCFYLTLITLSEFGLEVEDLSWDSGTLCIRQGIDSLTKRLADFTFPSSDLD